MSELWSNLSEIADLRMGETIIAADCDGLGLPIYSADTGSTPWNYSTAVRRKLSHGTIIVGARGSIGNPRMPDATHFGATQTTITVTPRLSDVRGRFLLWALRCADFSTIALQQAVPMLTVADLGRLQIRLFSTQEQTVITKVLDTLDTQIRRTEEVIAKLEQVKHGLLADLFTRGIDENGELRLPPEETPDVYKNSELGIIPKDWEAVNIDRLAHNEDSRRVPIKKATRNRGVYPYYGASGVIDWVDDYIFDGDYVLLGEDGENVISRQIPLAFRASGKIWVNNHAHVYKPKEDVDIRFLADVLERKSYARWVNGSAQPKLTQAALSYVRFIKPSFNEQRVIADTLEAIRKRISADRSSLIKLQQQKTGLMDDLLTGRVRVTPLLEEAEQATA